MSIEQKREVIEKMQKLKEAIKNNEGYKIGSEKELETIEYECSLKLTYVVIEGISLEAHTDTSSEHYKNYSELLEARSLIVHRDLKLKVLYWVLSYLDVADNKGKIITIDDLAGLKKRVQVYGIAIPEGNSLTDLRMSILEGISVASLNYYNSLKNLTELEKTYEEYRHQNTSLVL